jgi:molybdenum cofactor synthesis domain-containing protein
MADKDTVAACLILIGNEILSGRTQDKNLNFLAVGLNEIGIQLREVRVIPDVREKIVATINECRAEFDYVFTTGGIGPTHDDITSECIAEAFGVGMCRDQEIVELLNSYMKGRGNSQMNEARLRMATFPEGAVLIKNEVSAAPGYMIQNVFVMAGVPRIMQAMFREAKVHLKGGKSVQSRGLVVDLPEGTIAEPLALVQARFKEVDIGSYPQMRDVGFRVSVVARGTDPDRLDQVLGELMQSLRDIGGNPQEEDLSTAQSQSHVDD